MDIFASMANVSARRVIAIAFLLASLAACDPSDDPDAAPPTSAATSTTSTTFDPTPATVMQTIPGTGTSANANIVASQAFIVPSHGPFDGLLFVMVAQKVADAAAVVLIRNGLQGPVSGIGVEPTVRVGDRTLTATIDRVVPTTINRGEWAAVFLLFDEPLPDGPIEVTPITGRAEPHASLAVRAATLRSGAVTGVIVNDTALQVDGAVVVVMCANAEAQQVTSTHQTTVDASLPPSSRVDFNVGIGNNPCPKFAVLASAP